MPRKLKTFVTSQGFFDLAIAAPSMKAALEAWGANSNLFHQGFAKESDDPKIVSATLERPGVVLRRPVGTDGAFAEDAELPSDLDLGRAAKARPRGGGSRKLPPRKKTNAKDSANAARAAATYEKAEKKREAARRKKEAAEAKDRKRREALVENARAALEKAEREHQARADAINQAREGIEERASAEESRWREQSEMLKSAIREAGG